MTTFTPQLLKVVIKVQPDLGRTVRRVGPYRIERRLGAGGMGVVYLGRDDAGAVVAVKVIKPEFAADRQFRARLRREVTAARRVPRFCTAPVVGADLDAELPYIATEYIDGPSLDIAVLERGPLRGADLEGLATGVAVALRAIHDQSVIHRDLKPSNILLSSVGPRVIDFGIARLEDAQTQLTQAGGVVGTLAYMAPEQVRGGPVTTAVDLFAWASMVIYAATGRPPFGTDSDVRQRILTGQPDVGGLEEPLRGLVREAFAKDPVRRPTAADLVERLSRSTPAMAARVLETAATSPARPTPRRQKPASTPAGPGRELVDLDRPGPGTAPSQGSPPGLPMWVQRAIRVHRNWAIGVVAALVIAVSGAGLALAARDDSNKGAQVPGSSTTSSTPSSTLSAAAVGSGECVFSPNQEQAAVRGVGTPPAKPAYKTAATATVKTNLGDIVLDLDGAKAPCTVNSFAYLASKNFFDGSDCHRLVTQGIKVLQCGDPTGTGTGGPSYKYADENLPQPDAGAQAATYATGTLAMANAGPGTNGSQFFIVYGDSELPPNYTIFGKITSGMNIIQTVAVAGVKNDSGDGQPKKKVTIQDVTIAQR